MDEKAFIEKLKDMLKDECEGVTEYADLASAVETIHPKYAYALRQIAEDEYSHKNCLMKILTETNGFVPQETRDVLTKAEVKYSTM